MELDELLAADLKDESFRRWFLQDGGQATYIFKEAVVHGSKPLDSGAQRALNTGCTKWPNQ